MTEDKSPIRDPRIANLDMVRISSEDGRINRVERIENFSRSGLFIRTDDALPIGSMVNVEFTLLNESGDKPKIVAVRVSGEVVRHTQGGERAASGPGMGIRFIDIDESSQKLIDSIVTVNFESTPPSL